MTVAEPSFTLGIEEEYLLVNLETGDLAADPPREILHKCAERSDDRIAPEFLRPQIEVGTRVCRNLHEARSDLAELRMLVAEVTREYGLAPVAASTHPFALWMEQKHTVRARYIHLASEMQAAARRLLICGMHVHVGIEDDELRIDLMNQMKYFLPHLLALSTSSPLWEGQDTGLRSYRLTIFDGLPRTGLPEDFASFAEFQRHVGVLVNGGVLEDATMIWWDLRPSARYPTLETRIYDVCTRLDDALSLAALNVCLLRALYRLRRSNQKWRTYSAMLLNENRWRAMRYGTDSGLIDFALGEVVPFPKLLDEIIELVTPDAEALDCQGEIRHARTILERGTSAHRQLQVLRESLAAGLSEQEALREVVRFLINETQRSPDHVEHPD